MGSVETAKFDNFATATGCNVQITGGGGSSMSTPNIIGPMQEQHLRCSELKHSNWLK